MMWMRSNWRMDELWVPLPLKLGIGLISYDNIASISLEDRGSTPPIAYLHSNSQDVNKHANLRPKTFMGFTLVREPSVTYGSMPYWFVIAVTTVTAAAPWARDRFSLRTLFIATTLVAVVLGVIVWAVR
jgi:hypothetical protein